MSSARLRGVLLLVPDLEASLRFWQRGVGLSLSQRTEEWACLADGWIEVQQVQSVASSCAGYTPLLRLQVDDVDATVQRCVREGARMDGPIQRAAYGVVAASVRAPDGHMIGLVEVATDGMQDDGVRDAAGWAAKRRLAGHHGEGAGVVHGAAGRATEDASRVADAGGAGDNAGAPDAADRLADR
ncbi:hypothetical protein CDCA_CDCA06G1855 [Cyanidium caldarium]|uniref:VOC domain-containing protein n=1 Tax=Cyanidium caldarium TaxID=2771 RepID=A0AAV9IUR2_CYACA|nr:hypothetical protein CDCA_CDCA06G1855 [Cyanidium caldarium]